MSQSCRVKVLTAFYKVISMLNTKEQALLIDALASHLVEQGRIDDLKIQKYKRLLK